MGGVLKQSNTYNSNIKSSLPTFTNSNDESINQILKKIYFKYMSGLITTEEYVKNVGPYLNKKNLSPMSLKLNF